MHKTTCRNKHLTTSTTNKWTRAKMFGTHVGRFMATRGLMPLPPTAVASYMQKMERDGNELHGLRRSIAIALLGLSEQIRSAIILLSIYSLLAGIAAICLGLTMVLDFANADLRRGVVMLAVGLASSLPLMLMSLIGHKKVSFWRSVTFDEYVARFPGNIPHEVASTVEFIRDGCPGTDCRVAFLESTHLKDPFLYTVEGGVVEYWEVWGGDLKMMEDLRKATH